MADFLSNGVSALLAFQRALDVTSQNISNVSTPGYSRQRVDFVSNPAQPFGNGWLGSGVSVNSITRSYDEFLAQQVRTSASSYQRSDTFATLASRVDNMFSDSKTGLSAQLQKLTSAMQDVANTPNSVAPRQVLISTAQQLVSQLKQYDGQLATLDTEVESRLKTETSDINTLTQGIAQLNGEIKNAWAKTGQPPNDLLDQRDRLLDELSEHLNVSTTEVDGGVINVSVGNGQPLVLDSVASKLGTKQDLFDPTRSYLVLETATATVDVTKNMTGGTLGGLLDFREEVLDPARNTLGRISIGLASAMNAQQNAGMDLNGALGANLFAIGPAQTLASSGNTGTGALTVTRSNVAGLTDSDYLLQQTSGGWVLRNATTGAAVTMTGTGTVADPLVADGMSIVVGGTAATGDSFLIRPTRQATSGLSVLITNPSQIAAAAPVKTSVGTTNTGSATISGADVVTASNPALRNTVTIQFATPPTTYSINGAGSYAYTSGSPITYNGWSVTINGTPSAGDTFTVSDNTGGNGDNSNALKLAAALDKKVLNGGNDSVNAALGRFVANVGVVTQQAQNNAAAQKVVNAENVDARESVSGVNLDEEAANLLRYQQAYQAAAQLVSIANTLFNSLLAATSRN